MSLVLIAQICRDNNIYEDVIDNLEITGVMICDLEYDDDELHWFDKNESVHFIETIIYTCVVHNKYDILKKIHDIIQKLSIDYFPSIHAKVILNKALEIKNVDIFSLVLYNYCYDVDYISDYIFDDEEEEEFGWNHKKFNMYNIIFLLSVYYKNNDIYNIEFIIEKYISSAFDIIFYLSRFKDYYNILKYILDNNCGYKYYDKICPTTTEFQKYYSYSKKELLIKYRIHTRKK
jgi:hypothetical protein